jgi:predicted Zn-dependent protease
MLRSLFRRTPASGKEDTASLEAELAGIEKELTRPPDLQTPQRLIRAAEIATQLDRPRDGIGYYGRAIDLYIETGRLDAAAATCRKLLRMHPDAVRPLGTLAWIAVATGHTEEATLAIHNYVTAAAQAEQAEPAARSLLHMAGVVSSPKVRESIGEYLLDLGVDLEADRVLFDVYAERNGLKPPRPHDKAALSAALTRATMMSRDKLIEELVLEEAEELPLLQ